MLKIKPKLRFPEFDGEWEEKQLSAILEIGTGKSKVQSNESGKYNILGSTGIIGKSHTYDYEGDFILTARVGHYAGKLYKHAGKVNISDNTIYLFNFINKNFIYESLNAFKLEKLVFGSGQPLIKASDLKKLKIRVPVSKEQKKIGGFFSKLDRQIELEEQKLEKLEEQKKGYMQKLFSQEIRFKDNKGNNYPDWKIVEIGDILEERTERSGEGDMLSVTINNGIIKFDEIDRKDNSSKDKSNYRKVYKDDIAYNSMRMWQGASGKSEYEGIVSPAYTVTIPSENINPDFIAYYFKTHKMIHKFKINSQGLTSDTWNLKYRQLKDIKLNLCSKEEQNKIANLLIMYDKLINKQKHKLEILKTNKKGFLQKMFV